MHESPFGALRYLIVTNGRSIGQTRPHANEGYGKKGKMCDNGESGQSICVLSQITLTTSYVGYVSTVHQKVV